MSGCRGVDPDRLASERARLVAHRGLATWSDGSAGERRVPLAAFRAAASANGRALGEAERGAARALLLAPRNDDTPIEGPWRRIAVFGGLYSNRQALQSLLADAASRGAQAVYCLGDLGGFGPLPEACWPLLEQAPVRCLQGNYEQSLTRGADDCNCGYTDPRDNHFARLSYQYTASHCSAAFIRWMAALPPRRRLRLGDSELLLVHGSPRRVNEFLFASTTPVALLERLCDQERCDGFLCTHTGLPWVRHLPSGRLVANVGALGRPANDGDPRVRYALVEELGGEAHVEIVPLDYDHRALVAEMLAEGLPAEFAATVATGWWTTCLEVLPARERAASRF